MRHALISLGLLILSFGVLAQHNKIRFQHLSSDNGLSHNNVRKIIQDKKGFLWFGTLNGLSKYDGQQFTTYKYDKYDSATICHNIIDDLVEDNVGNLWIITESSGVSRLHLPTNLVSRYYFPTKPKIEITNVYFDGENLWFGFYGGIAKYDQSKDLFDLIELQNENSFLNVTDIISLNADTLILALGNDDRLLFFDKRTRKTRFHSYQTSKPVLIGSTAGNESKTLLKDPHGNIWIGALNHGLYKINLEEKSSTFLSTDSGPFRLSSNNVRSLFFDQASNELWVGTDGGGLNVFHTMSFIGEHYHHDPHDPSSLSSINGIYSIYEDKEGILWLGLYNGGANYYNRHQNRFSSFTHIAGSQASLSNKSVMSLHEDTQGHIWVGTDGGGLHLFNDEKGEFLRITENVESLSVIASIANLGSNELLVGTWNEGLFRFNKSTHEYKQVSLFTICGKGVLNRSAWDILETKDDNYWIATIDGGLTLIDHGLQGSSIWNHLIQTTTDVENNRLDARVLYEDSENDLWVGSRFNGVSRIQEKKGQIASYPFLRASENFSSTDVRSILEDRNKNMWFGTIADGLYQWIRKTGELVNYDESDGLPENTVMGLLEDDHGNLWMSNSHGITKFNIDQKQFTYFDKSDGLPGGEFKYNAAARHKDGRMMFGSSEGLCLFHPDSIKVENSNPRIVFTEFYLFNKKAQVRAPGSPLMQDISYTKSLELNHNQRSFSISFAAINEIVDKKTPLVYQLEGFDDHWNEVRNKNEAHYTNIAPGDYTFRVKSIKNMGRFDSEEAALPVIITPPFWKTNLAYFIYGSTCLLLLFLFRKISINKERVRNQYKTNMDKLRVLSNVSHELKTPLSLIKEPIEYLMTGDSLQSMAKRQEKYMLLHRNVQRITRVVNQLMQMAQGESSELPPDIQRKDLVVFVEDIQNAFLLHSHERTIRLTFKTLLSSLQVEFNQTHLENILYNLISNAFKFTSNGGCIEVSLTLFDKAGNEIVRANNNDQLYIKISVKDTGIGIPEDKIESIFERYSHGVALDKTIDKSSGLGLSFTKELTELNGGSISVSSQERSGSKFTITFPVFEGKLGNEISREDEPYIQNVSIDQMPKSYSSDGDKPLLLIVEDDIELRLELMRELADSYKLVDAGDGEKALQTIAQFAPDLILSDIKIPKLSGLELCWMVKSKMLTSHIPVILMTGNVGQSSHESSVKQGADLYIEKPINLQLLKAQIKNLLDTRKQLQMKFQQSIEIDTSQLTSNELDEKFLSDLIDYISKNIKDSNINATGLTKALGISRSLLYSKLKELTGESVNSFISNIRVKKSIPLLLNGYTITEASHKVGFSSYSYFARTFQKRMGMSPRAFLENAKREQPV